LYSDAFVIIPRIFSFAGITQARAKKYGREFLEVITRFSLKDGREIQAALAAQVPLSFVPDFFFPAVMSGKGFGGFGVHDPKCKITQKRDSGYRRRRQ